MVVIHTDDNGKAWFGCSIVENMEQKKPEFIQGANTVGSVIKSYFDYCGRCGKKREIVDGYTNFGRPSDCEPPEPVNLCAKCVNEEVAMWIALDTMPAHWIRANYETKLAEILGFEWVYLPRSSWGAWQPTEGRLNKWLPKSHQ